MPASCPSLAGQERQWKAGGRPAPLGLSVIAEEAEHGTDGAGRRQRGPGTDSKLTSEKRRSLGTPSLSSPAQIKNNNRSGNTPAPAALKVDERLKLARVRREERQKQLASRELGWAAREERAQRYYKKHLEERKRKLEEQRVKEERRRMAVEEKRRQRLKEEKERHESAVRRTMERSQKAKQRTNHSSRRGALNGSNAKAGATRRSPLTPWERDLVSRLLTPTVSYLARSRSAVCLSRQDAVSCHSTGATSSQKPQQRRGAAQQRAAAGTGQTGARQSSANRRTAGRRTTTPEPMTQDLEEGKNEGRGWKKQLTPTANVRPKPATTSPSTALGGTPSKAVCRTPVQKPEGLSTLPEEDCPAADHVLSSSNLRPEARSTPWPQEDAVLNSTVRPNADSPGPPTTTAPSSDGLVGSCQVSRERLSRPPAGTTDPERLSRPPAGTTDPERLSRPPAGTTDPEEASRLLLEKRRQARQQREREEEERRQREETERRSREELTRRRAEERAQLEAEAQRLAEERKRRDEEEQKRAEEEEACRLREEQQREEEEARQRQQAEQQRQERFEREEAARQERKKRLEEIMKRTRKTDTAEKKSAPSSIPAKEAQPKENTEPVQNRSLEEVIRLSGPSKGSKLGLSDEEDMVPAVAFKERRSLRTLAGLDEIQAHQRAEVI